MPSCLPRPAQAFFGLVSCDGECSTANNLTFLLGTPVEALFPLLFSIPSLERVVALSAFAWGPATTSPVSPFCVASSIFFLSSQYRGSVLSDTCCGRPLPEVDESISTYCDTIHGFLLL